MFETLLGAILRIVPGIAIWAYRKVWPRLRRVPGAVVSAARGRIAGRKLRTGVAAAALAGEVVVVNAVGANPTTVTWAGATDLTGFYYRDLQKYRHDMRAGRVPHRQAFCCGRAPKIGTRAKV